MLKSIWYIQAFSILLRVLHWVQFCNTRGASQGSQYALTDWPELPCLPVPAFIWTSEAGSCPYIFRKYLISFCLRPTAWKVCQLVLCIGLPHICFTPIQTVSHWQPESKMASLCVYWLCEWWICWVRSLSVSHTHTLRHTKALLFRPS